MCNLCYVSLSRFENQMNSQFDLLQYILCRRPAPDEATTTPRPTEGPIVTPEGK